MGQTLLEREDVLEEALDWEAGLQELHGRIAHRFSRSESRQRVLAYLQGLLGSVERKNGWQLAEYAGDATPDGVQRLLAVYQWDADEVRDDLRGYVVEHLGDAGGVLVVDETGFLKKGRRSVGVKRQYSGTAGKVENCQIGVFLAYGSRHGAAFLDRELYLPQEWAADGARRREAGVPQDVVFHTKAQLAQQMITRAVAAGVPFAWVTGDTVYGNDRKLRRWLEEQGRPYVLAVKSNEPLWADREGGAAQVAARELAQQIPDDRWQPLSAGDGSKGPRLYDWGWVPIGPGSEPDQGHWLWCVAASPILRTWPTTPVLVRERHRCRNWCAWRAPGGSSKTPSRRPSRRWGWTSTRCVCGSAGTGTSPWPCWPTPFWR